MSGVLIVWVGGLCATASNRPRTLRFNDVARANLSFQQIPVYATYYKGMMPLVDPFLPRHLCSGGGRHSSTFVLHRACLLARTLRRFTGCCLMSRIWNIWWACGLCTLDVQNSKRFVARHARLPCSLRDLSRGAWCRQRNATWLILPVVICLSQRLSHACVSMN